MLPETRESILLLLIGRKCGDEGQRAVTIQQIADANDVSRSTVYRVHREFLDESRAKLKRLAEQ